MESLAKLNNEEVKVIKTPSKNCEVYLSMNK